MSELKETRKTKSIAFRLTDEEYAQAESAAMAAGDTTNNWCRRLALAEANVGHDMTKNQRLIYEEIARVRYLAGNGFRLLLGSEPMTAARWKKITADADYSSEIIAAHLLSRRK